MNCAGDETTMDAAAYRQSLGLEARTGTEICRQGADVLRRAGFLVTVFNASGRVRTKNWVDLVALKHGVTWLVEVKGEGDRLRPGQRTFAEEVAQHEGPALHYVVARSLADVEQIAGVQA